MIVIQAPGLGEYQIDGEKEVEAARVFDEGYTRLCRDSGDGDSLLWELAALRREIIGEYGVRITLV